MALFRRRAVVPAPWVAEMRAEVAEAVAEAEGHRVVLAAIATVDEILPLARATGSGELVDQLIDLRLILTKGVAPDVGADLG